MTPHAQLRVTQRGFFVLEVAGSNGHGVVICESSHIGDYDDAMDNPGSSGLWFPSSTDGRALLEREAVEALRDALTLWLESKRLGPIEMVTP